MVTPLTPVRPEDLVGKGEGGGGGGSGFMVSSSSFFIIFLSSSSSVSSVSSVCLSVCVSVCLSVCVETRHYRKGVWEGEERKLSSDVTGSSGASKGS